MFDEDYKSPPRPPNDRDKLKEFYHPTPKPKFLDIPKTMNRMPKGTQEVQELADELVEWADKPDSVLLQQFAVSKKISPYQFFRYAEREVNAAFTQAFDYARAKCSIRMLLGECAIKDVALSKYIPLYDTFYGNFIKENEQRAHNYQKELKTLDIQKGTQDHSNFTIFMEPSKSNIKPCSVITVEKEKE